MRAMLDTLNHPAALLLPVLAHMALVLALYTWLTIARLRAVLAGRIGFAAFEFAGKEPPEVARVTRTLTNQFELPVLFYTAVLALLHLDAATRLDLALAWIFVIGRLAHTWVQTRMSNVPLRGRVFAVNLLAVTGLLLHLAIVVWRNA